MNRDKQKQDKRMLRIILLWSFLLSTSGPPPIDLGGKRFFFRTPLTLPTNKTLTGSGSRRLRVWCLCLGVRAERWRFSGKNVVARTYVFPKHPRASFFKTPRRTIYFVVYLRLAKKHNTTIGDPHEKQLAYPLSCRRGHNIFIKSTFTFTTEAGERMDLNGHSAQTASSAAVSSATIFNNEAVRHTHPIIIIQQVEGGGCCSVPPNASFAAKAVSCILLQHNTGFVQTFLLKSTNRR